MVHSSRFLAAGPLSAVDLAELHNDVDDQRAKQQSKNHGFLSFAVERMSFGCTTGPAVEKHRSGSCAPMSLAGCFRWTVLTLAVEHFFVLLFSFKCFSVSG